MSRSQRRKALEKILDRDHRSSLKWWRTNLATVTEGLRTGIKVDGSSMTDADRAQHEEIKGFILDNINMIESKIEGLLDFEKIAAKSIGEWMSGVDEDKVIRDFNAKASELTMSINQENQVRKKWI